LQRDRRRLLLRFERISGLHYAFKTLAYTMINQSPALLPDMIRGRRRPLAKFHCGAARHDPARPRHFQIAPE
jgi:hypothetical protein